MEYLVEGRDYKFIDGVLTVNEGVTHIPCRCFTNNKKIREIILPTTLISIGESAFKNSNLSGNKLVIPDSVKYIHGNAFSECGIENLVLGKNLIYVGNQAFNKNNISVLENNSTKLKLINYGAFSNNIQLKNIKFNNDINAYKSYNVFIDESAFYGTFVKMPTYNSSINEIDLSKTCSSNSDNFPEYLCCTKTRDKYSIENGVLKIKDGVEVIGSFEDLVVPITSVEMPDSVIIIQPGAFFQLENLENIKFSNSLIYIGDLAFSGCKLRKNEINIPSSLCSIDLNAFESNEGERKILLPNTTEKIFSENYVNKKNAITEIYDEYDNTSSFTNLRKRTLIDLNNLLEEDRITLESLELLPETIEKNSVINNNINNKQSIIMEKTFINIISNSDYDEEKNISLIKGILGIKEICVVDMHEIINYLFEKKQIKTIYLFMSYGYDFLGNSMISRAIINKMYEMIDVLIILGTDINEIGTIKMTPLSLACQIGDIKLVKHLIEKGAAINKEDQNNKKAIDYAIENNHQDIIDLLNNYNVDKSEAESDFETLSKQLSGGGI